MDTREFRRHAHPVSVLLLALVLLATPCSAQEQLWIPMGDLQLEATLYRPAGTGPHPIVVFNHGSTGYGRVSPKVTQLYPETARFFVERGLAVLIPMRRGRGASGGDYLERYECDPAVLTAGVTRAIEDMDAVMAFVPTQPWADTSRLLLGGMSRGGFTSIVYSSERKTTAKGLVNFAGGWAAERCNKRIGFHQRVLAQAGTTARLPMLWLYSENDQNYGPDAVRAFHHAFTQAGGTADLRMFPPIGHDGHILLPRSVDVWRVAVDDFLTRIGLGAKP